MLLCVLSLFPAWADNSHRDPALDKQRANLIAERCQLVSEHRSLLALGTEDIINLLVERQVALLESQTPSVTDPRPSALLQDEVAALERAANLHAQLARNLSELDAELKAMGVHMEPVTTSTATRPGPRRTTRYTTCP